MLAKLNVEWTYSVLSVGSKFSFVLLSFPLYLQKIGVTQKKADIEYVIANRVNRLFKQAIQRFKDDVTLWITYIKFCKQMVSLCADVHIIKILCGFWELNFLYHFSIVLISSVLCNFVDMCCLSNIYYMVLYGFIYAGLQILVSVIYIIL